MSCRDPRSGPVNRIPQHGHDTWVPPSRRVPGRLPSGSCTVDAYGSEAGDAWGRGAGTTRAAERVLTGPPSLCRQHNDCAVPPRAWFHHHAQQPQFSPRHDVLVHGVHHHARQQRRLWPIRPVGPSAFTETTTLGCTPLCLRSTAHDDGNRVTHQTDPAARSRVPAPGSRHHFRGYWGCQG